MQPFEAEATMFFESPSTKSWWRSRNFLGTPTPHIPDPTRFRLTLSLYAHWSISQSIAHDPYFICQSRLWTQKGESNLKHILAKMG